MITWLTIKDLSGYLQIPESRIRHLVRQRVMPFHNSHGFTRFHQQEIDEWMKLPKENQETGNALLINEEDYMYRGQPITDYTLTATIVLIGKTPWNRLPEFISKTISTVKDSDRDFLYREEFKPFLANFNDYLRISCQLGLIDNRKEDERKKHYYPTQFAEEIAKTRNLDRIRTMILDSILYLVRNNSETRPDEKHAILLLWLLLTLKNRGVEPTEEHFRLLKDKRDNHFPQIRLGLANGLDKFLFEDDNSKEGEFLAKWSALL